MSDGDFVLVAHILFYKHEISATDCDGEPIVICRGPNVHALHEQEYLGKPIISGNADIVCPRPDGISCVGCLASKEGQPL